MLPLDHYINEGYPTRLGGLVKERIEFFRLLQPNFLQ